MAYRRLSSQRDTHHRVAKSQTPRHNRDPVAIRGDTPRPSDVPLVGEHQATGVVRLPTEQVHWPYQCILNRRVNHGRVEYLVNWTPTWENGDSLFNLDQAVGEYEDLQRLGDESSIKSHASNRAHFNRPLSVTDTIMTENAFADAISKHGPQILTYEHIQLNNVETY